MGLCIESNENEQGISVEIRRDSVCLGIDTHGRDDVDVFCCDHSKHHGWTVEVDKAYLKRVIEFFTENQKYLETRRGEP